MPPKTTLENYMQVPHLEQVLLWFLNNDAQIKLIVSSTIKELFQSGYRPTSAEENDPNLLEEMAKKDGQTASIHIIERWLVIRMWLDLMVAKNSSEKTGRGFDLCFEERIDLLDEYGTQTLMIAGEIMHKYGIDPTVKDLENELSKIPTIEEKELFKQNFLADTLAAAEIRLLAWIYKELFDKEYQIKQH